MPEELTTDTTTTDTTTTDTTTTDTTTTDTALTDTALTDTTADTTPSFQDSLGDLKDNEKLKGFSSVEEMAKAFVDSPEHVVPEEYNLPEGFPDSFTPWAKSGGFTQEQVDSMLNMNSQLEEGRMKSNDSENEKGLNSLMESWGDETKQKENLNLAKRTLQHFDVNGKLSALLGDRSRGHAGNNADVIEFLYEIGKQTLAEDSFITGGKHTQQQKKSPADNIFDWKPPETN